MKYRKIRVVIVVLIVLVWLNEISENSYDNFMRETHGVTVGNNGSYNYYKLEEYGDFERRATYRNDTYLITIYHTTFLNADFEDEEESVTFKHFKFAGINFDYTDTRENDRKFLKAK